MAPASSLLKRPPFSFSTSAYTRLAFGRRHATPMRPMTPAGMPGVARDLRPRLATVGALEQCRCPDRRSTSGIPCGTPPTSRRTSPCGFVAIDRDVDRAGLVVAIQHACRHVLPPSVLLKTPRSALGTLYLPNDATNTMFGIRRMDADLRDRVGVVGSRRASTSFPRRCCGRRRRPA